MNKREKNIDDKDLAFVIGNIMRWGVILSLSITFIGGIIYLVKDGNAAIDYSNFVEQDYSVKDIFTNTFSGLLRLEHTAIITFGILLLFSTPIIRVLFSLIGFVLEKDKIYIAITLIVLAIIFISISGGLAH